MWEINDILQINPTHEEVFGACFMVVTEPKSWGAQGYIQTPGREGIAYYRINFDDAIKVGKAQWVLPEEVSKEEF